MSVNRRQIVGLLAGAAAAGLSGAAQAAEPGGWPGVHVMGGRKGYADTPLGQVHYRVIGEGVPLLLLHQTPWFSVQYAKVLPLLAAANIKAIAVDTPGFGFSDLPPEQPSIEDYADTLPYVLDALGLDRVAVAGFHTGASIAAAFAHTHKDRTACLILDGAPLYTEAERKERLSRAHWDQTPKRDGSHLTDRFSFIRDAITKGTAEAESMNWSVLSFFLAGESEHYGHVAAFSYDMAPAIREIVAPTLLISHSADSLHPAAARIRQMRPDFDYQEFEGGNSHIIYDDPQPWADVVIEFVKAHPAAGPARR
jgi:pimeloyl-ACP methyl ester carboxylesterase